MLNFEIQRAQMLILKEAEQAEQEDTENIISIQEFWRDVDWMKGVARHTKERLERKETLFKKYQPGMNKQLSEKNQDHNPKTNYALVWQADLALEGRQSLKECIENLKSATVLGLNCNGEPLKRGFEHYMLDQCMEWFKINFVAKDKDFKQVPDWLDKKLFGELENYALQMEYKELALLFYYFYFWAKKALPAEEALAFGKKAIEYGSQIATDLSKFVEQQDTQLKDKPVETAEQQDTQLKDEPVETAEQKPLAEGARPSELTDISNHEA